MRTACPATPAEKRAGRRLQRRNFRASRRRTSISRNRASPLNCAPKSSETVNSPFTMSTPSRQTVRPTCAPGGLGIEQSELQVVQPVGRATVTLELPLIGERRRDRRGDGNATDADEEHKRKDVTNGKLMSR